MSFKLLDYPTPYYIIKFLSTFPILSFLILILIHDIPVEAPHLLWYISIHRTAICNKAFGVFVNRLWNSSDFIKMIEKRVRFGAEVTNNLLSRGRREWVGREGEGGGSWVACMNVTNFRENIFTKPNINVFCTDYIINLELSFLFILF